MSQRIPKKDKPEQQLGRERIRELLKERHLTQRQLAEKIGFNGQSGANYINQVLTGKKAISDAFAEGVANYLNVTTEYILGKSPYKTREEEFTSEYITNENLKSIFPWLLSLFEINFKEVKNLYHKETLVSSNHPPVFNEGIEDKEETGIKEPDYHKMYEITCRGKTSLISGKEYYTLKKQVFYAIGNWIDQYLPWIDKEVVKECEFRFGLLSAPKYKVIDKSSKKK